VSVHMAAMSGRAVLPVVWLLGLGLALAYSLEPVRLKRRVWLNPLCLLFVLYGLPMAFGYIALAETARAEAIGVLAATGLQMLALILLNPAADVDSDRAAGLETPCVRHGIGPVATLAAAVFAVGAAAAAACFWLLMSGRGAGAYAGVATAVAGELFVLFEIARLAALTRGGRRSSSPEAARLAGRNPVHFAVLGVALALAAAAVCSNADRTGDRSPAAAAGHSVLKGEVR
jgi:4-hydroxybenzoate polyprenyltransferase